MMPRDPFDLKLKPFAETIFFYSNASKLLKGSLQKFFSRKNLGIWPNKEDELLLKTKRHIDKLVALDITSSGR